MGRPCHVRASPRSCVLNPHLCRPSSDTKDDGLALIYIDRWVYSRPEPSMMDASLYSFQASRARSYQPPSIRGIVSTPLGIAYRLHGIVTDHGGFRRNAGRPVRRPDCTLATVDHNVPYVSLLS